MLDFVLVTNTLWSEAPRMRHQVARLLRDAGARVLFFERPGYLWTSAQPVPTLVEPGMWLTHGTRIFHHQLRITSTMQWLDALLMARSAASATERWSQSGEFAVINFAYDALFLRKAFPDRKILTIIHDDFESQSRLPWASHIAGTLQRTCRNSDHVFAVSDPLMERLSGFCKPELFLPWAVEPYRSPPISDVSRNKLLFWGYVDASLDLELVEKISDQLIDRGPEWELWLVGPTQSRGIRPSIVARLASRSNVRILDSRSLNDLPIDEVLAAVLPYRRSGITNAVTLANKSMQLLARGLPLLISAMPRFVQAPFVIRLDGPGGVRAAIDAASLGFTTLQPAIEAYCADNAPESRLAAITRALQCELPRSSPPSR